MKTAEYHLSDCQVVYVVMEMLEKKGHNVRSTQPGSCGFCVRASPLNGDRHFSIPSSIASNFSLLLLLQRIECFIDQTIVANSRILIHSSFQ